MTNDALFFQRLFFDNYNAITSTPIAIYPRHTFRTMGMPLPRQYYAYKKLVKRGFGNDKKFLNSDLALADITTETIILIDNYYDQIFSKITNGKNYVLFITSGFFYGGSNAPRRIKMIQFLKKLASKGIEIYIHTQDEGLEAEFFNCSDEERKLIEQYIHIKWTYYRIDIHYIILQDREDIGSSHFFLEYPHSEYHLYRLDIHFTYNEIKEKFNGDPEKVFKYLLKLRKGGLTERIFYYLMKCFPVLRKYDLGIAFGF